MSRDLKSILYNALGSLKQKVILKWDSELPDAPANFMVRKWLPQQDILGHPNTKLYLTHSGLHSTEEAIYHSVPVVAVPGIADPLTNAMMMGRMGCGEVLSFDKLNSDLLRYV